MAPATATSTSTPPPTSPRRSPITINAKIQRPGVCNAAETLLVHEAVAAEFLPVVATALIAEGVELRGDAASRQIVPDMFEATDEDFATEFHDLIMSVGVVPSVEAAVDHVLRFGSGHTDAILSEDYQAIQTFVDGVDSAVTMVNASTRFTDGEEFGFGAEIGISHAEAARAGPDGSRGPDVRAVHPLRRRPGPLTEFSSPGEVADALKSVDYLPDDRISQVVFLAERLDKPVLVEGPAGVGKTELAKVTGRDPGRRLIRLQCYEGLDESKALYEWNYKKQLLRIRLQADSAASGRATRRRHLLRRLPARTSAARGDPFARSRSCCSSTRSTGSRSRPRPAARGALRLPGVDPRARDDDRSPDPDGRS